MMTTMNTGAASLSDEQKRAAITACALMIKGICLTTPNAEWTERIENRIHYLLRQIATTPQADAAPSELASMTRMFHAACADLGAINEALGLDPDDGGAEPILEAIAELKAAIAAGGAQEPIGHADVCPGSDGGFTMAVFKASDVPEGSPLYASPLPREAATVAEGFALVPVVMTAAMTNAWAGGRAVSSDEVAARTPFQDAWKRVLAAASNGEQ